MRRQAGLRRAADMRNLAKKIGERIRRMDSVLLVLALFVLLVFGAGAGAVGYGLSFRLGGCAALLVAAALLWLTVDRWCRWLTGLALIGAVKVFPEVTMGRSWVAPYPVVPRIQSGGVLVFLLILAAQAERFDDRRPHADEKLALVSFVVLLDVTLTIEGVVGRAAWALGAASLVLVLVRRPLLDWWRSRRSRKSQ